MSYNHSVQVPLCNTTLFYFHSVQVPLCNITLFYFHSVQVPFCNTTLFYCLQMRTTVNYSVSKLCQQEVLFYPETVVKVVMNHNFIRLHTATIQ